VRGRTRQSKCRKVERNERRSKQRPTEFFENRLIQRTKQELVVKRKDTESRDWKRVRCDGRKGLMRSDELQFSFFRCI